MQKTISIADKEFQNLADELNKESGLKKTSTGARKLMSVREMGDLLGIKKTDRYWLVKKNVFETKVILGKMWVDIYLSFVIVCTKKDDPVLKIA